MVTMDFLMPLFLTTIFILAFASTAFALPSSCSTNDYTFDIETIDSTYFNLSGEVTLWDGRNGFPNISRCLEYDFLIDATITQNITPKYSDSWTITIYDSQSNILCQKTGATQLSCSGGIKNGNKAFVVLSANNLSNHGESANGYLYSAKSSAYSTPTSQTQTCSAGFKCVKDGKLADFDYLQKQYKDCSWDNSRNNIVYCQWGCEKGSTECNPDPQSNISTPNCSTGYKCKEDGSKGYQNENCAWTSVTGCQYGCSNGECKPAPIIPTPTITNTNYYCNGNNVWQKITYSNGTITNNKYRECAGLCQNGNCIESNVPPTIKVLYQSPKVDVGYLASFKWNVTGNYSETGIEFGYRLNYSQMVKKVATKNSNNTYVALLSATKGNYYLFVRAYAAYNGKKVYSETRRIEIQKPVIHNILTDSLSKWQTQIKQTLKASNTDFVVAVNEIDITKMGIDGIKFFTIGSCLDNGLWDVWCALDLSSTALLAISIFNPYDGQIPDSIAVEAKYTKLAKVGELLKTIKTGDQFANLIKSVTVIYKDRAFVKTGLDFTNLLNKSIVKIEAGEIKAVAPSLFRYALEKGDYSIMNLIGKGVSKELLESAVKYGADLSKIKWITKNAKTIAWLEEGVTGTKGWGLLHIIEEGHIDQIAKALQIKTSEVQGVIKTVLETYNVARTNTIRNSFEFYKIYYVAGEQKIIQVVVSSTNVGRIVTATIVKAIPI